MEMEGRVANGNRNGQRWALEDPFDIVDMHINFYYSSIFIIKLLNQDNFSNFIKKPQMSS